MINEATAELVLAAQSVFVVTTPEVPSIGLAERRLEELKNIGVLHDRVRILLNRWHPAGQKPSRISETLRCPVAAAFPNNYPAVTNSILNATLVQPDTELGQAYRSFADFLSSGKACPLPSEDKPHGGVLRGLRLLGR